MLINSRTRFTRRGRAIIITALATLLLLAGAYLLLTALAPAARVLTVNPTNNATTRKIAEDSPKDAWLYIPKIDINVPYGQSEDSLYRGAWWRKPTNGNPKDGGNFVLAGHRFVMSSTPGGTAQRSPFYSIDKLDVGDKIYVDYKAERYTYEVTAKKSVKPNAVSIENRTVQPTLTLYSCTLQGSSDGRDVVVATRIKN